MRPKIRPRCHFRDRGVFLSDVPRVLWSDIVFRSHPKDIPSISSPWLGEGPSRYPGGMP